MPNSAATSVAALPLLSQSSTACCLKVLSNFFRVFLDSITGVFIQVVAFGVFLYLCPIFRAGPDGAGLGGVGSAEVFNHGRSQSVVDACVSAEGKPSWFAKATSIAGYSASRCACFCRKSRHSAKPTDSGVAIRL